MVIGEGSAWRELMRATLTIVPSIIHYATKVQWTIPVTMRLSCLTSAFIFRSTSCENIRKSNKFTYYLLSLSSIANGQQLGNKKRLGKNQIASDL